MQRTRTRNIGDEGSASPSWVRAVKQLDFYYKADADAGLLKRSKWGGVMTLSCAVILLYLVISEFVNYVSVDTVDVLTVDTRRGEKLPIQLDLLFPSLPCSEIAVDVVEASSGETLEEAAFQIIKQRLSSTGKALAEGKQNKLGSPDVQSDFDKDCPPCMPKEVPRSLLRFARHKLEKVCCFTCEQVRAYLQTNRLPQSIAEHTPQCKVTADYRDDEGCRVHGYLEVPRGKGDFHIAAGTGVSQSHESHQHHMHQIDWSRIHKFNITHTITSLSFGPPIPNVANPLDKHEIVAHTLAQHMYMIQVVPTTYESGRKSIHTNQYSFTQHHQRIESGANFALPGVYFKYEINPLMIHMHDKHQGFANFLTRICAIIGGLYVVFGILYSLTATVVKSTTTKKPKL